MATPGFERDFRRLSSEVADRVSKRILALSEHPEWMRFPLSHVPESLKGLHKYRIGEYRLLYWPEHQRREIVLYAIEHRRKIYRRLRGS